MRVALGIEYDGSAFCGWQSQPQGCGVQDVIETALARIGRHSISVVAAGRTDAGVHAAAQVLHFDTDATRPMSAWVRGTNAELPAGVSALWAQGVDAAFHARFRAIERTYVYVLLDRSVRPALLRNRVGWYHAALDVPAMAAAAQLLVGTHDFSAFRSVQCQSPTPVRELRSFDVARRGDFIVFTLRANAFLHRMVRNLVGCLVTIGKGRQSPQWAGEVLASHDRARAAPTFPPDGLYLAGVRYDSVWGLPNDGRVLAGAGWPPT